MQAREPIEAETKAKKEDENVGEGFSDPQSSQSPTASHAALFASLGDQGDTSPLIQAILALDIATIDQLCEEQGASSTLGQDKNVQANLKHIQTQEFQQMMSADIVRHIQSWGSWYQLFDDNSAYLPEREGHHYWQAANSDTLYSLERVGIFNDKIKLLEYTTIYKRKGRWDARLGVGDDVQARAKVGQWGSQCGRGCHQDMLWDRIRGEWLKMCGSTPEALVGLGTTIVTAKVSHITHLLTPCEQKQHGYR